MPGGYLWEAPNCFRSQLFLLTVAIGNDTREATLLKARLVGFLAAFVGLLWVTKTFVARRKKDNDVAKNDDSVTEDEMEMSEYSTSDDEMSYHRIT